MHKRSRLKTRTAHEQNRGTIEKERTTFRRNLPTFARRVHTFRRPRFCPSPSRAIAHTRIRLFSVFVFTPSPLFCKALYHCTL